MYTGTMNGDEAKALAEFLQSGNEYTFNFDGDDQELTIHQTGNTTVKVALELELVDPTP